MLSKVKWLCSEIRRQIEFYAVVREMRKNLKKWVEYDDYEPFIDARRVDAMKNLTEFTKNEIRREFKVPLDQIPVSYLEYRYAKQVEILKAAKGLGNAVDALVKHRQQVAGGIKTKIFVGDKNA